MARRYVSLLVACLALAAAVLGCKSAPPKLAPLPDEGGSLLLPPKAAPSVPDDQAVVDRVVAVVNDDVITMSELQEAVILYVRETREPLPEEGAERDRLVHQVLRRMVDHRLQIQEARREKLEVTDDEMASMVDDFVKRNGGDRARIDEQLKGQGLTWEQLRRDMRETLLAQKARARRVSRRASVTEAEVDAYVADNRVKFEAELKYHPRHLAILPQPADSAEAWERARAEADRIVARLASGADFAEAAREPPLDGAVVLGDDLGWLKRGELQPTFEGPILRLNRGEVTMPIKSDNGYHVFRLEEREDLTPEMLAQLRQQARDILLQKRMQERLEEWLQTLRQRALIAERL